MNTYYLVKSARGKIIFLIFYHSFHIIFVDIFFTYLYQNKTFLLTMKKNPENYTINDVFKYIGDHTFMSLQKQKYVLNIE